MSQETAGTPMRAILFLVAMLFLLPPALAGVVTPSYWEGEGEAEWTILGTAPSNHGDTHVDPIDCRGLIEIAVLGPRTRSLEAGDVTVTWGDASRDDTYRVRIDVTSPWDGCADLRYRLDSETQGLDVLDIPLGCDDDGCYGVALSWTEEGYGTLTIRDRVDGRVFELTAPIVATLVVGA